MKKIIVFICVLLLLIFCIWKISYVHPMEFSNFEDALKLSNAAPFSAYDAQQIVVAMNKKNPDPRTRIWFKQCFVLGKLYFFPRSLSKIKVTETGWYVDSQSGNAWFVDSNRICARPYGIKRSILLLNEHGERIEHD